ncbi:MAG: hypothetical protein M3R69_03635 [Acidobacteriota bacterium]|nr:hypothetical protein [Acidobacteriota bacterium]
MQTRKNSPLQHVLPALFVSALLLVFATSAQVQQSAKVSTTTAGGLRTVTFDTISGKVIVNLPDDMRAGDTISGTVVAEPEGETEDERSRNEKTLNSLFVNFAGSRVPVSAKTFKLSVRGRETTAVAGNPKLGDFRIIIEPPGPQDPPVKFFQGLLDDPFFFDIPAELLYRPAPQLPQQYAIPPLGQTGRPLVITGPFDGDSSNTRIDSKPNGGESPQTVPQAAVTRVMKGLWSVLAESPNKVVLSIPGNVTGPIQITVKEGDKQATGTYRNVGVNLSAPKTSLIKGESTTLKIEVSGLQGITEPVPLHLVKGGVVTMQGGDVQSMTIKPAEVQSNGTYTTTRTITGVQAGAWNATATVVVFNTCLEDDGDPLRVLLFSVTTGDYVFCPGRGSVAGANPISLSTLNFGGSDFTGGVRVAAGDVNDSGGSGPDRVSIGPGASMYKNGAVTVADFNYKPGYIHVQIDAFNHTGNAMVQTTKPKQTFTITDRDTRNNTCGCK